LPWWFMRVTVHSRPCSC